MKFAFSTVSCPKWDFETIAARAAEYGYDGVEVRGFLNESILTASNIFLTDPKKIRAMFQYHRLQIACLAGSIAYGQVKGLAGVLRTRRRNAALAEDVRKYIDFAQRIGCPYVKIFDTQVMPGQSRAQAGIQFGDWLLPLGDYAAQHDVVLLVENALSFRDSKELWFILDRLQHPSLACCWDLFNAALIGEAPAISVPTLNSRIQYTQVKDAKLGPLGASYCKLGEGDVEVANFIKRLRGIGYDGWMCFEWEKAWLPNIAEPEEILPDSINKLREWSKPQVEEEGDAKPQPQHKAPPPAAAGKSVPAPAH